MHFFIKVLVYSFILGYVFISSEEVLAAPREEVFEITAYYTPEKNQKRYAKGNYEEDTLLNGFGYMTSSGIAPYLGVVAAPKEFDFGTLMYIEGKGWVVVEDRGGAIDTLRLDLWTGRGDFGLKQALEWGRRKRKVTIFTDSFKNLEVYIFDKNLEYNMQDDKVKELQRYLKALGFFNHAITGYYGDVTREAVLDFQLWKGVIDAKDVRGAGRFGPGTRRRMNNFAKVVEDLQNKKQGAQKKYPPYKKDMELIEEFYSTHLSHGDSNYFVFLLQSRLERLGFFNHDYKTYDYKDKTHNAVLRYQLARGIVLSATDVGAGQFGPHTRQKLREELSTKKSLKKST